MPSSNTRFGVLLVCLCLQLPARSEATQGEYAWPLGKEAPVAGTFGEYREGHFHTGIDFSTGGKTGLPVYAVADGEVCRLADSLRGFGKALYLKHRDGNISVYAHLENFSGDIAKRVSRLRAAARLSFRDKLDTSIAPGSLPVRKGQEIGWSGESGDGLPHLHFELRRDEETPIHPFDFLPSPTDRTPPQLRAIGYMPVSEDETDPPLFSAGRYVDGRRFGWLPPGEWRPPSLAGKFWINLIVTDTSEYAGGYRLSPKKIVYGIDHGDTKTIQFDRLSYSSQENKKVGLIYDLGMASDPGSYIFRLYTGLPRPRSPSADRVSVVDASRMPADTHSLWLRVEDINGNASETEVSFVTIGPENRETGKSPAGRTRYFEKTFYPKKGRMERLATSDGRVTCDLSPSVFYSNEAVTLSFYDPTSPKADPTPPFEAMIPLTRVYRLEPAGIPLAMPVALSFTAPDTADAPLGKMAVFRLTSDPAGRNKWSFVGSIPDSTTRTVSAKIDRLSDYVLSDDSVAPHIFFPEDKLYSSKSEIHIAVSDRGSGIADTGQVVVDGKPHEEWYYDGDRGWIRLILKKVRRGAHRVDVTMADRLGNVSRETWSFKVR